MPFVRETTGYRFIPHTRGAQMAKFIGQTWDPPGSCRSHVGLMLAPWTLLLGAVMQKHFHAMTSSCLNSKSMEGNLHPAHVYCHLPWLDHAGNIDTIAKLIAVPFSLVIHVNLSNWLGIYAKYRIRFKTWLVSDLRKIIRSCQCRIKFIKTFWLVLMCKIDCGAVITRLIISS